MVLTKLTLATNNEVGDAQKEARLETILFNLGTAEKASRFISAANEAMPME